MSSPGPAPRPAPRYGFTLIEVAVTLAIVAIALTLCLQSLFTSKSMAAHTRNLKLARELGVLTLGQIESGLFQEEIQNGWGATYAQEGSPDFSFEILLGEEVFEELDRDDYRNQSYFHDSFAARQERQYEERRDAGEGDEDIEEPYEKIKIRVRFPRTAEYTPYLILERWMPWDQVYGREEDEEEASGAPGGAR